MTTLQCQSLSLAMFTLSVSNRNCWPTRARATQDIDQQWEIAFTKIFVASAMGSWYIKICA